MDTLNPRPHGSRAVEPLSEAAWSRVEAGLFARLDRGEHLAPPDATESAPATSSARPRPVSRRWGFVLAFAAAAAVAVWVQASPGSNPSTMARVEERVQDTRSHVAESPRDAPGDAERVADGAHIATTTESKRWRVGDSEVTLAAGSELVVAGSDAAGFRLSLEHGRVDCHVAPRAGRPAFVVDAGNATVTVIGTRFSVSRDASGARVEVEHGSVRVATPETSLLLGAGQRWPAPDGAPAPSEVASPIDRDAPTPARTTRPNGERRRIDPAARFDRATRLEETQPDAALRIYRELSQKPGPWAPNALYAAGRLELERQHTRRGRSLLEQYLKRYPEGANASDARDMLERR